MSSQTISIRASASLLIALCILTGVDDAESEPITITKWTFDNCQSGTIFRTTFCCPPRLVRDPVVDFKPSHDPSKPVRVRKALQCLEGEELRTYLEKLDRGYALMRALPYSDPRSLARQAEIHCTYGVGGLPQKPNLNANLTIDIHWNWLFLPFHRLFVYFHERILQKLLDDEDFSLHFWNFDGGPSDGPVPHDCTCSKVGHFFPEAYNYPELHTFESNRSSRTREKGRIVDLSWDVRTWNRSLGPPVLPDYKPKKQILMNKEVLHRTIVREAVDAPGLFGKEFRVGVVPVPRNGSSLFELLPHSSIHVWVGGSGLHTYVPTAARDPIFYAVHANIERFWSVWRDLDESHKDPTDPDWLNASFLLWDENAVLRRVCVRDLVDTRKLGYVHEKVNDGNWINFKPRKGS